MGGWAGGRMCRRVRGCARVRSSRFGIKAQRVLGDAVAAKRMVTKWFLTSTRPSLWPCMFRSRQVSKQVRCSGSTKGPETTDGSAAVRVSPATSHRGLPRLTAGACSTHGTLAGMSRHGASSDMLVLCRLDTEPPPPGGSCSVGRLTYGCLRSDVTCGVERPRLVKQTTPRICLPSSSQ